MQMTNTEANAVVTHPSAPPEFARLLHRLLVLASQLRLASRDFGDLSGLPQEHAAAGLVVQEASAGLDELYNLLHEWHRQHEQPAKRSVVPVPDKLGVVPVPEIAQTAVRKVNLVNLVLKGYAPDDKVSVIRTVKEIFPGYSLAQAKALLERELPLCLAEGLGWGEAQAMVEKFEAVGATCRIASFK